MGVNYIVATIDDEMREWLDECNILFPAGISRLPTPSEVRETISSISNISVEYRVSSLGEWCASIERSPDSNHPDGLWTTAWINDYEGDDEPSDLSFEKGHAILIVDLLSKLSVKTGPLVLVPDTGDLPIVIEPSIDINKAVSEWEGFDNGAA